MKATTRTFKSGNSIAVRIPHKFNLVAGKTFEIRRRGKELVLIEHEETLAGLIDAFKGMPSDFFAEGRDDPRPKPIPDFDDPMYTVPPKKRAATKRASAKKKS
jgi:antitoxin VapB